MCCCTHILPGLHYMFVVPMPGRQSLVHSACFFNQRQSSSHTRGFRSSPSWWDWTGAVHECQMPGLWALMAFGLLGGAELLWAAVRNHKTLAVLARAALSPKPVPSRKPRHKRRKCFQS